MVLFCGESHSIELAETDDFASYFRKMVKIFSAPLIYDIFVKPPGVNPLSLKIQHDTKLYPYFKNTIGAVDGSHIPAAPLAHDAAAY